MKRITIAVGVAMALAACALLSSAQSGAAKGGRVIGSLTAVTGKVGVVRAGSSLKGVGLGTKIWDNDLVQTGRNSSAEVSFDPAAGLKGSIKVKQGSSFYLKIADLGSGGKGTTVDLMTGNIDTSVKRSAPENGFQVKTQTASMGVRGTVFTVVTSVRGGVIVTCDEGEVSCADLDGEGNPLPDGSSASAIPGQAVTKSPGEAFKAVPVATGDYASFRDRWIADEVEVFRANPVVTVQKLEQRYSALASGFSKAIKALRKSKTLAKWLASDASGATYDPMDPQVMREKKEIYPLIIGVYKDARVFELVYYRVSDALDLIPASQQGALIRDGLKIGDFAKKFNADRGVFAEGMSLFNAAVRSYALRNGGGVAGILDDDGEDGE
jgi:hypothetical protein